MNCPESFDPLSCVYMGNTREKLSVKFDRDYLVRHFDSHKHLLYSWFRARVDCEDDALELLAQLRQRMLTTSALPEDHGSVLATWFFKVAKNIYIDWKRRRANCTNGIPHHFPTPGDPFAQVVFSVDVHAAIDSLQPEYRECLLADMEDMSGQEAAQFLGITKPAYKSRLYRARAKLATLLQDYR